MLQPWGPTCDLVCFITKETAGRDKSFFGSASKTAVGGTLKREERRRTGRVEKVALRCFLGCRAITALPSVRDARLPLPMESIPCNKVLVNPIIPTHTLLPISMPVSLPTALLAPLASTAAADHTRRRLILVVLIPSTIGRGPLPAL